MELSSTTICRFLPAHHLMGVHSWNSSVVSLKQLDVFFMLILSLRHVSALFTEDFYILITPVIHETLH
jgi:hypothetical protein